MFNLQRRTFMALLLATASPVGTLAQVPGVSPLCADRPPVTGSQLSIRPPSERPSRAGTRPDRPASDLLCIDLFSTASGKDAVGVIG
ncbi:MAG: hypothetical protein KAG66_23795, partial [Methylococcales bacterium]|nr:hypothetical protein [Methylococcales bacterium]